MKQQCSSPDRLYIAEKIAIFQAIVKSVLSIKNKE